jgi:hypothetical protein
MNSKRSLHYLSVAFMVLISASYLSCKKENINKEILKPEIQDKISGYLNGPHISNLNYSEVASNFQDLNLGILGKSFHSNPGKDKLMSVDAPEVYEGFLINKDSVKVISAEGHTSYIFQVPLSSPYARSFQNLTIDITKERVIAFVNTYTPTRQWVQQWQAGHPGKFDGEIVMTPVNLGESKILGTLISEQSLSSSVNKGQTTSSLNSRPAVAVAQVCESTSYYYEVAYTCGSGLHLPGEACSLTDGGRAGYASFASVITTCTVVGGGGDSGGGGGGNTTPNVPPGYNPCPTPPPIYSRVGRSSEKFAVREGTTPCDPVAPEIIGSEQEKKENNLQRELSWNDGMLLDCAIVKFFKPLANFKAPNVVNNRIATLNSTTAVGSLFTDPFYVQTIKNASGHQINLDRFEVNVGILPVIGGRRLTASEFLSYIRLHINSFLDTRLGSFQPYNDPNDIFNDTYNWNSTTPLGSLLHLDISGDNGSVIVTDYNENHWTVSTIRTPYDAQHPVSGNRTWGYSQDENGFHFFVTGADRLTTPIHDIANIIFNIPFSKADELWIGFQNNLTAFINANQGLAAVGSKITERPNYNAIKNYFDGKITIEQLKALKACK